MKADFFLSLLGTTRISGIASATGMSPFLHALNVGTLATWLSVAGFGVIGIAMPGTFGASREDKPRDPYADLESIVLTEDFNVGDLPPSQETDTGTTGEADGTQTDVPFAEQETLPAPPEMPEVAEVTPLPEIPDVPRPTEKPAQAGDTPPAKPRLVSNPANRTPTRSNMPTSTTGGSPQGKTGATGQAGYGGRNGGSGMSDAKRLADGRMPAPSYPAEARAKGQTGTVLVEFVVGEDGRVVSAEAKQASPWPILNERAVSAVRRWKFPPGSVAKFTRPIVFKLN
jgi:periplasmic protein TonB